MTSTTFFLHKIEYRSSLVADDRPDMLEKLLSLYFWWKFFMDLL